MTYEKNTIIVDVFKWTQKATMEIVIIDTQNLQKTLSYKIYIKLISVGKVYCNSIVDFGSQLLFLTKLNRNMVVILVLKEAFCRKYFFRA